MENKENAVENTETALNVRAEETPDNKQRGKSLAQRLWDQIDILEREQEKITAIDGSNTNTRAVRSERLAFSTQITETAKTIILLKRREK